MTYNHPSMFITRKEYEKHRYNPRLKSLSDYQFVLEAYMRDPNILLYVPKPIVNYRLGGVSMKISRKLSRKEGLIARKAAGLNKLQRISALVFGIGVAFILNFKNRITN